MERLIVPIVVSNAGSDSICMDGYTTLVFKEQSPANVNIKFGHCLRAYVIRAAIAWDAWSCWWAGQWDGRCSLPEQGEIMLPNRPWAIRESERKLSLFPLLRLGR